MKKTVAIVGAGHAGVQVAASLRAEGFDGAVKLISSEAQRPYHRPPLSKSFLASADTEFQDLRPASSYEREDIDLRLGVRIEGIDRRRGQLLASHGPAIDFDELVLATGTRPRIPEIPGIALDGVVFLRSAEDALTLRTRLSQACHVVIIGGGFIGLEVAATARELGRSVSLVERGPRLMGRAVSPIISDHFLRLHRQRGVSVHLDSGLRRITGENGSAIGVETDRGILLPADLVLVGIGAVPNIELAASVGLDVGDGINVDEYLATTDQEIAAIGDVASFPLSPGGPRVRIESVQNANEQAKALARRISGRCGPYRATPWFWSDQGGSKLQMVGLNQSSQLSVVRGRPESQAFSVFHYADGQLIAVESVNRGADHMVGRRLLSAGMSVEPDRAVDETLDLKSLLMA